MDQSLERYNLPKLIQEEADQENNSVSIKESESKINNLPGRKYQV